MKEAAIHPRGIQQAHGAEVAIRQDRFRTGLAGYPQKILGDRVQRLVPTNALETALALGADSLLRVQQPIRRVFAFQVACNFAAQKTSCDGVVRAAAKDRKSTRLN